MSISSWKKYNINEKQKENRTLSKISVEKKNSRLIRNMLRYQKGVRAATDVIDAFE
jgi:hypothetical protein